MPIPSHPMSISSPTTPLYEYVATSMSSAPNMVSTFSINTRVTLFFAEWKTTTPATYTLAIVFLFGLGLFNRFLGAVKSQLDRRWSERTHNVESGTIDSLNRSNSMIRRIGGWLPSIRGQTGLRYDEEQEKDPLTPVPAANDLVSRELPQNRKRGFCVPNAPWSLKRDGGRGVLEFVRVLIGYILMLAVMTYNVGFLFAVTGSVLLGEMVFGRYTQH
ncbi:hypothetical protein CC78DRAFT_617732 [Lojkania enalia]|uniref:Copper transport protein n=1 Tax=Lojkania enalia TaxID=147567 RepID=A0A9P4N366_9PLEO|nr:hypothetical protein CC78DRAFT_617732 [Didymosphaeria enalia]